MVWLIAPLGYARAQEDARTSAAARALFQEGVTCSDAGDWACAVERFGRAYALRASPVIGSNYGIALMHVGRSVEASEAFRAVQRDPSAAEPLRSDATQYIAQLDQLIGRLTLHATGPTEGVAITVDGHEHTSLLDVPAPCDPGQHTIEARRGGEVVASVTVELAPAARSTVELAIPEPPPPGVEEPPVVVAPVVAPVVVDEPASDLALETPEPASHHEVYEEWWFWTVIGVVAVGAGVTIGVVASQPTTQLPMGSLGTIDTRPP